MVRKHSPKATAITAVSRIGYAAPWLRGAMAASRQAPAKIAPASAIIIILRRPSASLAIGTWAATTVIVLASSSSPISSAPTPI